MPSFRSEWFWSDWLQAKDADCAAFMKQNYKPDFTYPDFAKDFTAEFYDPDQWADIFNASGARYVVLVSKHHEGFTNWPSKYSFSWNSVGVGPNKDLVGMLANSIRKKTNIHFGLYHSLFEWFNPLFLQDKANNWATNDFVVRKTMPELYELVKAYKPDIIWSDGDWDAKDVYWNSTNFLAWLYNDSPVKNTVVSNDRWGKGIMCHHGGFLTCSDRYNPGVLQKKKWENAMTLDKQSWGYRRNTNITQFLTMDDLIETLVKTVSCGGNILINVGPTKEGTIIPLFEERLRALGGWLDVNGEAIYKTRPWKFQNDTETPRVWYTAKKTESGSISVYAIVLDWPDPGPFKLGAPVPISRKTEIHLLGYPDPIGWKVPANGTEKGIYLEIPVIPFNHQPCDYAWVFKMDYLENQIIWY